MAHGGSSSRWKLQDLQDLEQYGLAAELESTKLEGNPPHQYQNDTNSLFLSDAAFPSYDMSGVLSELMDNSECEIPLLSLPPPMNLESLPQVVNSVLKAPTAHGVKNTQEELTYMQKGYSYELHLNYSGGDQGAETMFKSILLLTFSELRLKNCEEEQLEQWIRDHPMQRLLEIDNVGCGGVSTVLNSDTSLQAISFTWSSSVSAIMAFKVNCLSTEFAARKHGGERGVPLRLQLDTYTVSSLEGSTGNATTGDGGQERLMERSVCNIKVFKDKGAERKQRQEQLKMEKLSFQEQANYHKSQTVTVLRPVEIPTDNVAMVIKQPATPTSVPQPPDNASSFPVTTPTRPHPINSSTLESSASTTVEHARTWLTTNRFGQFLSLFTNYTCQDLLRLSRRDLFDLCGAADGIRLYNALRSHTVKVIYIAMGTDKLCHAICLERLTAQELIAKVTEKLGIPLQSVSSLVRLTSTGILVLVDNTVVHNIRDEEVFLLQAIKQEDGKYQVVLRDHSPCDQSALSIRGEELRH